MKSCLKFLLVAALAGLALAAGAQTQAPAASAPGAQQPPTVSASARRLYERSKGQLLQIRTLLKTQDSQASVGSGFLVSDDGHIVTNYHVISQFALEPDSYRLRYATTDGQGGALELLDFDARRDLALLRAVGDGLKGRGALGFRPQSQPLAKGERIYSMGNPHDVAFAVVEGNYNGLVERSFDPLIYYAGGINPGMSGGPVLDEDGRVVGVNVSTLLFAQQVSFLVPGEFAEGLVRRSLGAKPIHTAAWARLRDQLTRYQDELVTRFLSQPWESANNDRYRLPVPRQDFMRCWGRGTSADTKGLDFERSQCRMDHALFVSGSLQTGWLDMSHEAYDGSKLGPLRFARQYSQSFRNERLGAADKARTAPYCKEQFVDRDGLPLRAVVCLRAYRKLDGLHDLSVLVTTVDSSTQGALGRFDAKGVSFDNALKLAAHYLEGFAWTNSSKAK
ncbi:serine protease [Roseateles saccharophilus]|uniref:S1-C subfamily serine protease n=1 Tax=Roseateles saccharophilus TaxID=304 RepID=A0A4R3VEI4_ROSSA|nr:serine protease [Roseateles saccharophilus]MDG0834959.1 serine protease [Roseateles saccharophilus]TCV02132.1 S1-C subfamily serine protease [Roseateles saccharophilus]